MLRRRKLSTWERRRKRRAGRTARAAAAGGGREERRSRTGCVSLRASSERRSPEGVWSGEPRQERRWQVGLGSGEAKRERKRCAGWPAPLTETELSGGTGAGLGHAGRAGAFGRVRALRPGPGAQASEVVASDRIGAVTPGPQRAACAAARGRRPTAQRLPGAIRAASGESAGEGDVGDPGLLAPSNNAKCSADEKSASNAKYEN